jgi:hypothetical protein
MEFNVKLIQNKSVYLFIWFMQQKKNYILEKKSQKTDCLISFLMHIHLRMICYLQMYYILLF